MMVNRQKSALLNLRIDPALKDAAADAARKERRSLTSLIEFLLVKYLEEHGNLKDKPSS